jgi:hypothetical protein
MMVVLLLTHLLTTTTNTTTTLFTTTTYYDYYYDGVIDIHTYIISTHLSTHYTHIYYSNGPKLPLSFCGQKFKNQKTTQRSE